MVIDYSVIYRDVLRTVTCELFSCTIQISIFNNENNSDKCVSTTQSYKYPLHVYAVHRKKSPIIARNKVYLYGEKKSGKIRQDDKYACLTAAR